MTRQMEAIGGQTGMEEREPTAADLHGRRLLVNVLQHVRQTLSGARLVLPADVALEGRHEKGEFFLRLSCADQFL